MADAAKSYVSKSGKDIVCPSGAAFGYSKPKASRKPSAALYKINASESEDE